MREIGATMAAQQAGSEQQGRIADRLAAARRGRFVGRADELARFRAALLVPEPPFVVLHLHGPGGVGKTTLLREFARVAAECGRPVARVDGRDIEPSPDAFLRAYRRASAPPEEETGAPPADGVLLIDTYELIAALDRWLRDTFIPQLPARSVVVIAGREAPAPAWRTDLDWVVLRPSVVALANVAHLATSVEGRLSHPPASVLELVEALHPTPAVAPACSSASNRCPGRRTNCDSLCGPGW